MSPDYGRFGSPERDWRQPTAAFDYSTLHRNDYLAAARRADLLLAERETVACRQPVVGWNHDLVGPTESWRQHLAVNDPEWSEDDGPSLFDREVAA